MLVLVLVFVFVLAVIAFAAGVMIVIVRQVVAHRATGGATQPGTDGGAGRATQRIADHRTACRTDSAADRGFVPVAFGGGDGAACGPADTGANRRSGAAANLLANNVTQRAAQSATDGSVAISRGHGALCEQNTQGKGGQD
ncbi:hypothetical protein D3C73_1404460 [compost metagenome]